MEVCSIRFISSPEHSILRDTPLFQFVMPAIDYSQSSTQPTAGLRRPGESLLRYFYELSAGSRYLMSHAEWPVRHGNDEYALSRFLWAGPKGGGETLRIGLFATLNGDEPEGAFALARFLSALEREPESARGYALYFYPLCNPTGYEDGTRLTRARDALNRLFWTGSSAPEVKALESEIWMQAFHGIVHLRSDADSKGTYGFASGPVLSEALLEPALRATEAYLPRNQQRQKEGIPSRRGLVYSEIYNAPKEGLRAVPGLKYPPFEVTLATPRKAPVYLQVEALNAALQVILSEYRSVQSIAQHI